MSEIFSAEVEAVWQKTMIRGRYFNEYYQSAVKAQPGFLGKISRWNNKKGAFFRRFSIAMTPPVVVYAGILGAIAAGALLPVMILAGPLGTLGTLATLPVMKTAEKKAQKAATKAFDEDIANGTLAARYDKEVTQPWLQKHPPLSKEEWEAHLAERRRAKADFAAAADSAPAAKPARKHRLSLRHKPKL